MPNARLRAAFYRGGTSKAVVLNAADLPEDRSVWDWIFLHVLGSPDPYGRQLNGMGGGVSSLSKIVIVSPSEREDADVDYTFVQIAVLDPVADYATTCGNMSSCVGAFAVEEGMVDAPGTEALVRIHNTNTGQIYHARFPVADGVPVEVGDLAIPGVAGSGAPVKLDFLDPGGAGTGQLLPSGNAVDELLLADGTTIEASLIDAAMPVVFVRAADVGCLGTESPSDLDSRNDLMSKMERIRRAGAVAMGLADAEDHVAMSVPKVAMVAPPAAFQSLDGATHEATSFDVAVRLISVGNFHKAITLSGANCVGVGAKIPGTLIHDVAQGDGDLRVGNPSGVLPVSAVVEVAGSEAVAKSATTYRTYRRIMEGAVLYPMSLLDGA